MPAAPAAAAAAVHQPKIVQTAFIHKLYSMLEDPSIQHLISWSASAESFVMSPSADFSKVLAYVNLSQSTLANGLSENRQYFKHTNISSFVRQLNMYGFHKVSDVFHTTNPETALWEFKHGNGNFKRGDLVGLREIKRRASRHALVHREYPNSKPSPSQPGTPAEPMPPPNDGSDPRMGGIEHTLYDMSMRLQRSEENAHYMHASSPLRGAPPPPPPGPHPLAQVEPPTGSLARRHTSADIRAHGWQPAAPPFASGPPSGPPSGPWPSSPSRLAPEDQRLRESLSTYSLQGATQSRPLSRPATPPAPFSNGGGEVFGAWSWNSANRDNKNLSVRDSSGPPTRRGSMAHILNPTDTAERDDEDEDPRGDDDRKRKRMQ
ncbi:hypothetical protein Brms1b_002365 [Colletotrichum noveboracense]|nr:hypothetical protein COL940_003168 [Colletotrichum noveboracense]KAJ0322149.1 hypothetical protein Brms1b_002365 [Colletotrichum noveboracense]